MQLKYFFFLLFLLFFHAHFFCQDYFSYGGGNYSGLNQVFLNPAAAADNRLKMDVITVGVDFNFNNSLFGIQREALKRSDGKFPDTWKNRTPNVPDNFYKNLLFINSADERSAVMENRIIMPSVLYQLDAQNSFVFTWSVRQVANLDGFSNNLVNLFQNEFDLNVTQNNRITNADLRAIQMSWAEYGITYARVLKNKNGHFLKAGITPKLLQGLESGYFFIEDMDFYFTNKDTSSYFKSDFSAAHSANFNGFFKRSGNVSSKYHYVTNPSVGLDLGIIYEWRPTATKVGNSVITNNNDENLKNLYKLKLGLSVVDIGKIKFDKAGNYYDLEIDVSKNNVSKFTSAASFNMLDSILKTDFASSDQSDQFSVMLPTAVNAQADYSFNSFLFLNLSAHIGNLFKANPYRVHNFSAVCIAPRFEKYWFEASVAFTFNALSARRYEYIMTGLNLRAGPLSVGTNNLLPFFAGDIYTLSFYAMLKVSIPHKKVKANK